MSQPYLLIPDMTAPTPGNSDLLLLSRLTTLKIKKKLKGGQNPENETPKLIIGTNNETFTLVKDC